MHTVFESFPQHVQATLMPEMSLHQLETWYEYFLPVEAKFLVEKAFFKNLDLVHLKCASHIQAVKLRNQLKGCFYQTYLHFDNYLICYRLRPEIKELFLVDLGEVQQ